MYNVVNLLLIFSIPKYTKKNNSTINKKKVFVMMYKYINNTTFESNETFILLNSLKNTFDNQLTIKVFYYDENRGSNSFLSELLDYNPEYLIMSSYSGKNVKQPPISIIKYLKKHALSQTNFITLMWDSSSKDTFKNYKEVLNLSDLGVIIDGSSFYEKYNHQFNLIKMYCPQDQKLYFYDKKISKDIEILFLGSTTSYRFNREEYIKFLLSNKVKLKTNGNTFMSGHDYADLTRRAQIVINFSYSSDNSHQIKGRVFEALHSGCLLLESKNEITSQYLTPGVDYVEYTSKEDLFSKIIYYQEHSQEREQIALSGYKKAQEFYSDKVFWNTVFNYFKDNNGHDNYTNNE